MTTPLRLAYLLVGSGFVFFACAAASGETLEEMEKKLVDAHSKLKSYSARLRETEDIPRAGGDYVKSDTQGTAEWMRKGDRILYRMEISGKSTQKFGASESKGEQTSTLVCDGEMFYTLGEQAGQKRFIKQNRDTSINGDFHSMLDMVRDGNDVTPISDEKVDGADCHVVEIKPKKRPSDDDPIQRTLAYFRKDIGLNVKVASFNKDGKEVFTHTLFDLKIDVAIDPGRFVLKAPEDAEITDLSSLDEKPANPSPPKP